MYGFGINKRLFPKLEVLRGYDPQESTKLSASYRVAAGETILSGMVVTPKWNATDSVYEWVAGIGANAGDDVSKIPVYVALVDGAEYSVVAANSLPALSARGEFEIETAFIKTGNITPGGGVSGAQGAYNLGEPIFACFDDDVPAGGAAGDLKGYFRTAVAAETGDLLRVGVITRIHGLKDVASTNPDCTNTKVVSLNLAEGVVTLV